MARSSQDHNQGPMDCASCTVISAGRILRMPHHYIWTRVSGQKGVEAFRALTLHARWALTLQCATPCAVMACITWFATLSARIILPNKKP
jgi:hypothetical protein